MKIKQVDFKDKLAQALYSFINKMIFGGFARKYEIPNLEFPSNFLIEQTQRRKKAFS